MKKLVYILLYFLLPFVGWAQQKQDTTDALGRLLHTLETYQKKYPQEHVYLHTDRSYYQSGEDIWFKAYITVSQFNFLSAISKIMYVELLNEQQEVVQSRRLPVISGLSMGDFKLPGTLLSGTYHIRAYTNWMRNFDEALFFQKTITIADSLSQGVFATADFQSLKINQDSILGTVHFHDIHGQALVSRQVDYTARLSAKSSVHGKGVIDEKGVLSLKLPSSGQRKNTRGSLRLTIENGNRPPIVTSVPLAIGLKKPSVQFYPEGGTLVNEIETKIGFQATLAAVPYLVKGYLESNGQHILSFASDSTGTGHFTLTPESGNVYTAVIPLNGGDTLRTQLPPTQAKGFGLAVNNLTNENVQAKVTTQVSSVKHQTLTIIAQNNGLVFYAAKHQLADSEFAFSISKSKLPSGVIHLALLDDEMHLLAERALFIAHRSDSLPVSLRTNRTVYHPREEVNVQFQTKSQHDSTNVGAFSASVVNLSKIPDQQEDIFAALWLNANTYRSPPLSNTFTRLTPKQIDNRLLCTSPNRDFWQNIRDGKFPENAYKPEKELKISGTITSPNGEPLSKAKVTLVFLQNATAVLDTLTNAEGRFSFDKILFYNQPEFIVQARDAKGRKDVKILLDESPNQQLAETKNTSEVKISPSKSQDSTGYSRNRRSLDDLQEEGFDGNSIVLEEVKVTDKKENPAKYSSNLNGPGNADQVIDGNELFMQNCSSLDICLQGRLTGVVFRGGVPYSTRSLNRPMQVMLDGMYVDAYTLNTVSPLDVASVEVLRTIGNTGIYGMYGANGVIIITTRRGDQPYTLDNKLYSPGITTFSPQGFYAIRNFQSPDYSKKVNEPTRRDTRTTIDWQADIIVDSQNPGHFSFYTADEPDVYRITVEGIDLNGRLAHREMTIRVE